MKQFTITIPDNKVRAFIEMIKGVSYVKNIEDSTSIDISEEHMQIVRDRITKYEKEPESYQSWDDIEKKIKLE